MADFMRRRSGVLVPPGYEDPGGYRPRSTCDMLGMGAMLMGGSVGADPYFANVSLLLQPTSGQADGTITDFSPVGATVTKDGTCTTSNSNIQFANTKSIVINGDGNGCHLADSDVYYLPGDFTVECWFNNGSGVNARLYDQRNDANNFFSFVMVGNKIGLQITSGGSTLVNITGATTLSNSVYNYVAATRSGNNYNVYANSASSDGSATSASSPGNYGTGPYVGMQSDGSTAINGVIAAVRLTKGVARTIVVPTAVFPTS